MLIAISILGLSLAAAVLAGESAGLELYPFITTNASGEAHLILRITNRGESEQTVLTENFTMYSLGGSMNGRRMPDVDLRFDINTMGTEKDPEQWKFVPSLPKLGPVTLRKGETAESRIRLDSDFVVAIQKTPDGVVSIRYTIGERIAKRYALWHGTIEVKETGRSLLSR
jgi:hypothetical protein